MEVKLSLENTALWPIPMSSLGVHPEIYIYIFLNDPVHTEYKSPQLHPLFLHCWQNPLKMTATNFQWVYKLDDKLCLASLISSRCALSSALLNAVPSALPALSEARATTISLAGQTLTWSRADLACDGFAEFPQFLKAGPAPVSSLPWLQLSTAGAHPRFLYSRPQPQTQMFAGVHLDGEWGSLVQGYVMATASWAAGQLPAAVGSVGRHRAPATCVPSYSEAQW